MVYRGTYMVERIAVNPMDNFNETHFIELSKAAEAPVFEVTCSSNKDWVYEFYMSNNSDYEQIKFNIMEAVFEYETMEELLSALSEIFEDGFVNILIPDECDGDCENCKDCNDEILN